MPKKKPLYPHVPKGKLPTHVTGPASMEKYAKELLVKRLLSEWIDRQVISEVIIEDMKEADVPVTLENAKTVWLDVLQNELPDAIKSSIKYRLSSGTRR